MTPDRTATEPGKCGCCLTPYAAGSLLHTEHGKWVLTNHDRPWAPPPPPRPRGDVHEWRAAP